MKTTVCTQRSLYLGIACLLLFVAVMLNACTSTKPAGQTLNDRDNPTGINPPVVLSVQEREAVENGYLWYYQDITFTDPDGDAVAMTYSVVSSSLPYAINLPDEEPIAASPEEQKDGTIFTVSGGCGQKIDLIFESRIRDAAGNLSDPVVFTMSCTAPLPLDTTPLWKSGLMVGAPIGLLLFLGFWFLYRKQPEQRLPALRSVLLLFFLFMFARFAHLILHEGGHSIYPWIKGMPVTLYIHPFLFQGYSRPIIDESIWKDILGSVVALPIGALLYLLGWKHRSTWLFPILFLVPYIALVDGFNVMGFMGDFRNLCETNGLPAAPFLLVGGVIVLFGFITLMSLFPLAGLDPRNQKTILILPMALYLASMVTFVTAHLFVPGSWFNKEYFLAGVIVPSANTFLFTFLLGIFFAAVYLTLFRKWAPRLPEWLHAEITPVTWKTLLLPGLLWMVSITVGLLVIT
ncbi:MAG: hypothetical protein HPY85_00020 [Anaerolineae bacterium]|nr:hypothetical protein [Anaerolineae bacterium]